MKSLGLSISGNEINHSHMKGLLHNYGIFTIEVVAIIRYISKTSWRVRSVDWRVKERQSAPRRLCVGSTEVRGVFGALESQFSTTYRKSRRNTMISLPGHIASLLWCLRQSVDKKCIKLHTTSQNLFALHEDMGLQR